MQRHVPDLGGGKSGWDQGKDVQGLSFGPPCLATGLEGSQGAQRDSVSLPLAAVDGGPTVLETCQEGVRVLGWSLKTMTTPPLGLKSVQDMPPYLGAQISNL